MLPCYAVKVRLLVFYLGIKNLSGIESLWRQVLVHSANMGIYCLKKQNYPPDFCLVGFLMFNVMSLHCIAHIIFCTYWLDNFLFSFVIDNNTTAK